MIPNDSIDGLIDQARDGSEDALARVFESYRPRLARMVMLRIDARVRSRIDASDVLQDAFIELARRLPDYDEQEGLPFFLWLRMITGERLTQLHRMHLGAAKRSAGREISLQQNIIPEASTVFLAAQLIGQFTSVDRSLIRHEILSKIERALNQLDGKDREVIAMRHYEELSTEEIATVLGLTRSGVLKRYTRAIRRLRDELPNENDTVA